MSHDTRVAEAIARTKAIYARDNGGAGCCLHIVTDDGNVESGHVEACLNRAIAEGHADCEALARLLSGMSKTQRLRVYREHGR